MNNIINKLILSAVIFSVVFLSYCTDQYENHALAIKNNTLDSIQVNRHYSGSIQVRTMMIAPEEYGKFYETSSEFWLTPAVELEKSCDSLIITGFNNDIPFKIVFSLNKTEHYCNSPYNSSTLWTTEVIVKEEPKFIGKTLEHYYIHIFDIDPSCINTNK